MQCVSGMHYNFSINPDSLAFLTNSNHQVDIDEAYLGLIRNFKRLFWFVLLEFGQTNVVDKSFINNREHKLEKLNSKDMYLLDATSLRMSDIGYQSKAQKNLNIKYNSLSGFLKKIKDAITVPYKDFEALGLLDSNDEYHQISNGIIQIENEYYDAIRPKRSSLNGLRPYNLLKEYGIEYLEVRGVDLLPDDITGTSVHHMQFLDIILIYCLIDQSPKISDDEKEKIDLNDSKVIYKGRDKDTNIDKNNRVVNINEARNEIIDDLKLVASFFEDSESFLESIEYVLSSVSGKIPKNSFHSDGVKKAKENIKILRSNGSVNLDGIKKEAELSLNKLKEIPENTNEEMNEFVKNYNLRL